PSPVQRAASQARHDSCCIQLYTCHLNNPLRRLSTRKDLNPKSDLNFQVHQSAKRAAKTGTRRLPFLRKLIVMALGLEAKAECISYAVFCLKKKRSSACKA